ncbi:MAG: oxidoreductase [Propionivibrio sp.]
MHTLQQALGSGFGAASTAAEVMAGISLVGKTAIVTGGYSGLGLETVRVFLAAGARVIVPARDLTRAAVQMASVPGAELWPMDLLDPASIDAFAARFVAEGVPLHILVNSAGIMAVPTRELDARGFELQFATNHLGHFQLTCRLWPALVAADGARVVAVSSRGHRFAPVDFDDPHFTHRPYDPWTAYGQSKTANVLFALGLDRRGQAAGIRAFAVHPGGIVNTHLAKHLNPEDLRAAGAIDAAGRPIIDPSIGFKNVAQGAATQVWCATSPQLAQYGGVYCEDVNIAALMPEDAPVFALGNRDGIARNGVRAYAVDAAAAERLWTLSESLTGAMEVTEGADNALW